MSTLFTTYRVLAMIVAVLLVVGSFFALPLRYLLPEGSTWQLVGEQASIVWVVHGWIYIAYVVVAFLLAHRMGWSMRYILLMLVAGLIPLLMFFVEHRVVRRAREEHPELA